MTIKEKLAAIYKEIANKEKTMWCKYLVYKKNEPDEIIEAIEEWVSFTLFFGENDYAMSPSEVDYYEYYNIKEVIWHPVMIGDVLDWIEPYWWVFAQSVNLDIERTRKGTLLLSVRKQKRKPIEDQSDECIDYVYSLIGNKNE